MTLLLLHGMRDNIKVCFQWQDMARRLLEMPLAEFTKFVTRIYTWYCTYESDAKMNWLLIIFKFMVKQGRFPGTHQGRLKFNKFRMRLHWQLVADEETKVLGSPSPLSLRRRRLVYRRQHYQAHGQTMAGV